MSPQSIPLENGEFGDLSGGPETRAIHLLWAPGKKLEGEVRKEEGGEDQWCPPPRGPQLPNNAIGREQKAQPPTASKRRRPLRT